MLEVAGLTKRFGGFTAVKEVGFEVAEGEILGLIGPNGSGKSTIFNLIAGALRPNQGSIRFAGREVAGLVPAKVCHLGIARTFQIPRPFRKLSIFDNALVAAYYGHGGDLGPDEAKAIAADALATVKLPVEPGVPVDGLGAAGLKKLELARALATRPKLLLADESLGGLDDSEIEQAADMLAAIRRDKGITIIWVEHIMGVLMRVVDRCIVLDHGEKIAEGTPDGGRPRPARDRGLPRHRRRRGPGAGRRACAELGGGGGGGGEGVWGGGGGGGARGGPSPLQRLLHEQAERVVAVAAERPAAAEAGALVEPDRCILLDAGLEAQRRDPSTHRLLDRIENCPADAAAARLGQHEHALDLGTAVARQPIGAAAQRHAGLARHEERDIGRPCASTSSP